MYKTVVRQNWEAYSEPCQTTKMWFFCKNSYQLKAVEFFR